MTDKLKQTVRIVRRPKVRTDERGHTVWAGDVEEADLELVSTATLKQILDSGDDDKKKQIREAAAGKDGVLAHDAEKDRFEIIDDEDVKAALDSAQELDPTEAADVEIEPLASRAETGDEELSLVSTQALRRLLDPDDAGPDDGEETLPPDTGFDPYNSA